MWVCMCVPVISQWERKCVYEVPPRVIGSQLIWLAHLSAAFHVRVRGVLETCLNNLDLAFVLIRLCCSLWTPTRLPIFFNSFLSLQTECTAAREQKVHKKRAGCIWGKMVKKKKKKCSLMIPQMRLWGWGRDAGINLKVKEGNSRVEV